jgi:AcrR family transcriptional regulator
MRPRRPLVGLAVAALAGWALLAVFPFAIDRAPAQGRLSNSQVVANLLEIVFGSEFVGEESMVVRKWSGPMRLAIYARDAERYRPLVRPHLDRLRLLTGLDIRLVDGSEPDQNAFVFVFGREQFYAYADQHLGPGKNPRTNRFLACFGYFHANGRKDIDEITAVIPSFISDDEIRACVVEEVTQAIGLPNDSDSAEPSIFNDDDLYQDLTWQDELLLRVLYDPRVRSGMTRTEFEPLARQIVDELRPGH